MRPIARFIAAAIAALALVAPAAAIDVKQIRSPGGVEAWLVEEHGLPIISVQAGFDGGARLDPEGKEGLAYLVSTLVNEGAGDYDSTAFLQKLEEKAISFGGSADKDAFYIGLTTLAANKAEAFELARLAIAAPRYDQEAIDRMKAQILAAQKEQDEDPTSIAGRIWAERAYPGHPYGRRLIGSAESLAAITRDDIVGYAASRLGRDKLKVVIVGDISEAEAGPLLDALFASIPETRQTPDAAPVEMAGGGQLEKIERPIPQSVVIFGAPGLKMTDPDYRAAQVMNYILGGGGFASRLMKEVRKERGLSYGVYTGLSNSRLTDALVGQFASDNARVKEALDVVKAEIARMGEGGAADDELADAKAYLTGSYPLRFDTNAKIASGLLGLYLAGFDKDYVNRRNAEIESVTKDDVARVARRLLKPESFFYVVVGQPQGL